MKISFITFRSVTFAQRGEGILRRAGMVCTLQRTPRWMEEQGCGYCLRVRVGDVANAVELLRQQKVRFRKVYIQQSDSEVEELQI